MARKKAMSIDEELAILEAETARLLALKAEQTKAIQAQQDVQIITLIRKHIANDFKSFNADNFIYTINNICTQPVQAPKKTRAKRKAKAPVTPPAVSKTPPKK